MNSNEEDIIKTLIRIREEQGISQRQLAALTGIKQPAIARLESGRTAPNIATLNKLLTPLGYTLTISQISEKKEDFDYV
ncbi:MAG: helix-turn-helix transcriptional regulator [Clostridia bacterium]|nr:helix-turn-helix transcriptional regulator [Clostridia bacterium]